jgi:hypothetical protein
MSFMVKSDEPVKRSTAFETILRCRKTVQHCEVALVQALIGGVLEDRAVLSLIVSKLLRNK